MTFIPGATQGRADRRATAPPATAKIGYRVSVGRPANARREMEGSCRGIAGLPHRAIDAPGLPADRARRLLVIYNPVAGRGSARRLRRFLDHLARLAVPVVLRETARPG